ncbi:response regulator [Sphingomonas sabuli]|uniref:Response regulator n=1 Tax=Sphingomonas sabuli TaxID=2764186 RepID=A0A7G9L3F0_9SPHN|nr:response regulator [Sphingomonas sabuli]QNM83149.1 response regulator [Sphingomonas sabuli]
MLFGKRNRVVKRILIVEDEPLTAFDNEVRIGDLGYEVVATVDGFEQAVALIESEEVHLVLSDFRLSGEQTGLDLAHAAKKHGVPVLFATGHQVPEDAKPSALGCLRKPYSERQLKQALDTVDRMLAGEKVKTPRGLDIYPASDG